MTLPYFPPVDLSINTERSLTNVSVLYIICPGVSVTEISFVVILCGSEHTSYAECFALSCFSFIKAVYISISGCDDLY